ncbi:hypothetical protein FB567DRAFT_476158 [Paraphoma chrysanthemicola]|uniref:Mmc1 C-terminal domain-containing protein n=1 Tax=Paraphoma chrysanthemicola TaxID=798071 RepID=A0A8K0VV13_9PLEO|nr:hypothetical protein FB567DRAFT_476158 [Paraphoma chrysanthemicola]
MPPWAATAPRLTTLLNGRAIVRLSSQSCCRHASTPRSLNLRVRSASTHVAPTAINLRPNIPARNKELHDALSALSGAAETYVNISRLQLALGGLAAQDAVTRVAVLGLNSQLSAQQLARLLLADPLGSEEPWEKELGKINDQRAVLLKYGDEADAPPPTPLYRVLSVPSRVLRSHNLEILVSTLNVNTSDIIAATTENSEESILVPKLQATPPRGLPVPYPVHKTLIFGEGLDSALAFGRFASDTRGDLGGMIKIAIDLPAPSEEPKPDAQARSTAVNVQVGAQAIATFRESIQNSIAYEKGWYRSGLPSLSTWLTQDLEPSEPIKPIVKTLVSSVVDDVEANILKADTAQIHKLAALASTQNTSASITTHLDSWAEQSHAELRDQLDDAFSSRNWHKLAWWKLFWRVDDVTMLATEILERRWLTSAEKSSIYLAGRMNQAGYPDELQQPVGYVVPEATTLETAPTIENPRTDLSTEVRKSIPWPEQIAAARSEIIADTVPPLQALAQRLILQTFSTTSISSALSALIYVSVSSFSVFEASAVAALGLTFSLRRMQKLWEGAREVWEGTAREEGRLTLKKTEEVVRMIVKGEERRRAGLTVDEDEGVKERRKAREAVKKVREALERVGKDVR